MRSIWIPAKSMLEWRVLDYKYSYRDYAKSLLDTAELKYKCTQLKIMMEGNSMRIIVSILFLLAPVVASAQNNQNMNEAGLQNMMQLMHTYLGNRLS